MNHPSFFVALAFYFIGLGLITYWLAYQTVRLIKSVQKIKASRQDARVYVDVQDLQILRTVESLTGKRHPARK